MINYLQNISGKTPVSMLPEIINHNNKAIESEFNWIYDTSTNRLTKSVYAPTGSVKAHFGEFVNLAAEYITIKNIDSLKNTMKSAIQKLEHNTFSKCWSSDSIQQVYENPENEMTLCHDASVIAYKQSNVYQTLAAMQTDIYDLKQTVQALNNPQHNVYSAGNILESDNEDVIQNTVITYDRNLLYASPLQLKRKKLPALHQTDLNSGNFYSYYSIINGEVTINDINTACMDTENIGLTVFINFEDTGANEYYRILLDRKNRKYVRITKNPLNILQLKSVSHSEEFGSVWKLYNYSVVNPNDIILENK